MAVSKEDAQSLVFQYSEWLDGSGLMVPESVADPRTHEQLVEEFLATRDANAIPEVEVSP